MKRVERSRHRTIPIFIPEEACPHRCIYCNQFRISGQSNPPSDEEVRNTIVSHLSTFPQNCAVEIGFFGGTFTGLSLESQRRYLTLVKPFLGDGSIGSIRLSTRPDRITPEIVQLLSESGVSTVELGVQTLDEEVLRRSGRGYDVKAVEEAAEIIRAAGMEVGMQMMIGLPGDSKEKAMRTAEKIVQLGATNTRIYPTLVVRDTAMEKMFERGMYQPLTLDEAVDWTKELLKIFDRGGVRVLRVGLHPTRGLIEGTDYLAGPFHVSFKELVLTALWHDIFEREYHKDDKNKIWKVSVPTESLGAAAGYEKRNRKWLEERLAGVAFLGDESLSGYEYKIAKIILER